MDRGILPLLLSGIILVALAAIPPMLPDSMMASHFSSAKAEKAPTPKANAINLNSSRSNSYRMGGGSGAKAGGGAAKLTGNTQSQKNKRLNAQPDPLNPQPEPPGLIR